MAVNRFDQACRYAAKRLDEVGFLAWLLGESPAELRFVRWLDTRTLPFPGEPDRICDTVARLADVDPALHWAVPVEFCLRPETEMFGRLMIYLGQLWLEVRPNESRGERYQLGAVVVNLTGRGRTGREMRLRRTGIRTALQPLERDLVHENALATLDGIAAGRIARCVLPWIPLMTGGGDPAIIARWMELGKAEPDERRRGDYGGLALVFADAVGRKTIWKDALKEWNMVESSVVREWMDSAILKDRIALLLRLLKKRFMAQLPTDLVTAIQTETDLDRLEQWFDAAVDAVTLDDFRRAMTS